MAFASKHSPQISPFAFLCHLDALAYHPDLGGLHQILADSDDSQTLPRDLVDPPYFHPAELLGDLHSSLFHRWCFCGWFQVDYSEQVDSHCSASSGVRSDAADLHPRHSDYWGSASRYWFLVGPYQVDHWHSVDLHCAVSLEPRFDAEGLSIQHSASSVEHSALPQLSVLQERSVHFAAGEAANQGISHSACKRYQVLG